MRLWKRLVPWLFALAIAANLWELATLTVLHWNGDTGRRLVRASEPFLQQTVAVSDPAFAAGFRAGDLVDIRERLRANGFDNPVPGAPYRLIAHRGARTIAATIIPVQAPLDPSQIVRIVAVFWLIGFALLIAIRGTPSRENALLLTVLLALALVSALDRTVWPDSRLTFTFVWILSPILWDTACVALVLYAQCFGERLSAFRRLLALVVYAAIAVDLVRSPVYGSATIYAWTDPNNGIVNVFGWGGFFTWHQLFFALLCVAAAIPAAHRDERQRLAWVIASFTPYLVGVAAGNATNEAPVWFAVQNASFFFIPAGLTYAALAKRMFDVGFVVNRAAVFAGVSVVVVGAFVLVEWALGRWFENVSHATSLTVNAGLALILGLSIRYVHKKIDTAVDNVFFRKRHENETALRRFAREAGFFTDAHTLIERAHTTILAHSEATTADVVLANDIDSNDAAVVAMRAWHEPVDLTNRATSLHGEMAFPMLAHETFVGAIVCGEKKTGERYAPDEIDALGQLAHGVGLALEGFERKGSNGVSLEQMSETLSAISAKLDDLKGLVSS
jgi:hypothetical protein